MSTVHILGQPQLVFLRDESRVPVLSILQRAFKYDPSEARLIHSDSCTLKVEHGHTVYQSDTLHQSAEPAGWWSIAARSVRQAARVDRTLNRTPSACCK